MSRDKYTIRGDENYPQPAVEVLSTLEKALSTFHGQEQPKSNGNVSDIDQIKIVLQSILDKVRGIDRFLREMPTYRGQTYQASREQQEADQARANILNEKAKKVLQGELMEATKE